MNKEEFSAKISVPKEKDKMIYLDCAGYEKVKNRCARKTGAVNCLGCSQYESKEDYTRKLVKCAKRLLSLPLAEQQYICEKYHRKPDEWYKIIKQGEEEK